MFTASNICNHWRMSVCVGVKWGVLVGGSEIDEECWF